MSELYTVKTAGMYIDILREKGLLLGAAGFDEAARARRVGHISYDSRDVAPDTLFICKGLHFKEAYLGDALASGAFCYMAEQPYAVNAPCLLVSDLRLAMSVVSGFFFDAVWNRRLCMVGITGTKGKSTTATFVRAILDAHCRRTGQRPCGFLSGIATYDGAREEKARKMTTPETLDLHRHLVRCVENGVRYLVMETSSQALKYHRTAALHYAVGAFLNLSEDHISAQEHPDMEDYLRSKLRLFDQCDVACINADMEEPYLSAVREKAAGSCARTFTFGLKAGADYRGLHVEAGPAAIRLDVLPAGEAGAPGLPDAHGADILRDVTVSIGGAYNASNALAAIAICRQLGVSYDSIREGLAGVRVAGRMELYRLRDKDVDVIVDYAHNKLSYETLFTNVKQLYPGRRIMLVFGCHGDKAYNRRKDLGELADLYADAIVLTEQDPGTESVLDICAQIRQHLSPDKPVTTIVDRGEAIAAACASVPDGWVLIIAGNGADGYQKRGLTYVPLPTDGERVQAYIDAHGA